MNGKIATITSKQKNSALMSNGGASGKNKQAVNTKPSFQYQEQKTKTNTNKRKDKADAPNNTSNQEKGNQKKRKSTPQQSNKRTLSTKRSNAQNGSNR
eukprot:6483986-Ditylum_brightwellii.AAC.1